MGDRNGLSLAGISAVDGVEAGRVKVPVERKGEVSSAGLLATIGVSVIVVAGRLKVGGEDGVGLAENEGVAGVAGWGLGLRLAGIGGTGKSI